MIEIFANGMRVLQITVCILFLDIATNASLPKQTKQFPLLCIYLHFKGLWNIGLFLFTYSQMHVSRKRTQHLCQIVVTQVKREHLEI